MTEWSLDKWIWSEPETCFRKYSPYSAFEKDFSKYAIVEFRREYRFDQKVTKAELRFSGDTAFVLELNSEILATGPVSAGGDFLGNEMPRPRHFATEMCVEPDSDELTFFSRVKLTPVQINEYSRGHGGFMLTGRLTFEDGTSEIICTDSSWSCRKNPSYVSPDEFDSSREPEAWHPAAVIPDVWSCMTAPIPPREEKLILPEETVILAPHETKDVFLPLDMIYGGFLRLDVKQAKAVRITVRCIETDEEGTFERFFFDRPICYRGFRMHSAGGFRVHAENASDETAEIKVGMIATCYPVTRCAHTVTSDPELNRIMDVCAHTLRYCRQMMHLDGPRHCEPLACTGDYYIETLMTACSFGDMELACLDVIRTADLLRYNDGRMFHTTYSLIWVYMLEDIYRFTGDTELLRENTDALLILLKRFESYLGENGIIDDPPDYMFIDWLYVDGISLHHPPKALGQTCLNMFYYGALRSAARIFAILEDSAMSENCTARADRLKERVNALLYDPERKLYFEGLNTPTDEKRLGRWMPQNVSKRYYRRHANILAAYFGVCSEPAELLRRTLEDDSLGLFQPYFAHFVLEAIRKNGLRDQWTLRILDMWRAPIRECAKGLAEGFHKPEPTYSFDHSHAWSGTPLYSLPVSLLGLEITGAGYKTIKLDPSLLGLEWADVEIPTPYGMLKCRLRKDCEPVYEIPDGIRVIKE